MECHKLVYHVVTFLILSDTTSSHKWENAGYARWAYDCKFPYQETFKTHKSLVDQCKDFCQDTSPCTQFVWTNREGGTCELKSLNFSYAQYKTIEPSKYFERIVMNYFEVSALCGFLQISWKDFGGNREYGWANNCEFLGQDLEIIKTVNHDNCRFMCNKQPQCTHYSWTMFEGGTCWIKSGGTSRGKEVYSPHSVCGIEKNSNDTTPQLPDYECQCDC